MISYRYKGGDKTDNFLKVSIKKIKQIDFEKYGEAGVAALASATPKATGKTAASWYYTVKNQNGIISITFNNSNIVNGVPIAIVLHYGHSTKNGGWIQGRDYIKPAIRPVFDKMTNKMWEEVTSL